jgi:hypothetical protein
MAKPEDRPQFKDRSASTAFLRSCGIAIGNTGLETMATLDRGPKYSIINGRALYLEKDLLGWIDSEAQQGPQACRRGRRGADDPAKPVSSRAKRAPARPDQGSP